MDVPEGWVLRSSVELQCMYCRYETTDIWPHKLLEGPVAVHWRCPRCGRGGCPHLLSASDVLVADDPRPIERVPVTDDDDY